MQNFKIMIQQLLDGKYRCIQKVPKNTVKFQTYIIQQVIDEKKQNRKSKKYIAKIQNLYYEKKTMQGKSVLQKKPRDALVLEQEIQILLDIERNIDKIGFPKAYDVYSLNNKRILVTDLRSLKLPKLVPLIFKQLSPTQYTKICLKIIYDLLDRIQTIHRANYLHQYLRPDFINFKKGDNSNDVLLISDFSKTYKYNQYNIKKENYHKPYQFSVKPRGRAAYQSIWSHAKITKSRRDDLQSFCYISIYLLRGGQLPWQDIQFGTDQAKQQQIFKRKLMLLDLDIFQSEKQQQQTAIKVFFMNIVQAISSKSQLGSMKGAKIPKQIKQILLQVRNLGFQEQPNYHAIRKILKKAMNRFQILQTDEYNFPLEESVLYPLGS